MKLYKVELSVNLVEAGDADRVKPNSALPPLSEGFAKDSPIGEAAKLIEKLQDRGLLGGILFPLPTLPGLPDCDTMNMRHTFQVYAGSYAELESVLKKFREVADRLSMPAET